jgi:hypothetical protein
MIFVYKIHEKQPNKRVQSDTAVAVRIGAKIGYVTRFELRLTSVNSRRG